MKVRGSGRVGRTEIRREGNGVDVADRDKDLAEGKDQLEQGSDCYDTLDHHMPLPPQQRLCRRLHDGGPDEEKRKRSNERKRDCGAVPSL